MRTLDARTKAIYLKTAGHCHICGRRLSQSALGKPGGWERDHSIPRACGGTDRLTNLYPACVACNRSKQAWSTRSARTRHGLTRAPLSREQTSSRRLENTVVGLALGALLGHALLGPAWSVGSLLGALLGRSAKV